MCVSQCKHARVDWLSCSCCCQLWTVYAMEELLLNSTVSFLKPFHVERLQFSGLHFYYILWTCGKVDCFCKENAVYRTRRCQINSYSKFNRKGFRFRRDTCPGKKRPSFSNLNATRNWTWSIFARMDVSMRSKWLMLFECDAHAIGRDHACQLLCIPGKACSFRIGRTDGNQ